MGITEAKRAKLFNLLEKILDKYGGKVTLEVLGEVLKSVGGGNAYPVGKVLIELAEIDW